MYIITIVYVIALICLNFVWGRYVKDLEYSLLKKIMLPVGLLALKCTRYKFNTTYDFKLITYMKILVGNDNAKYRLYIFTSYKISLVIFLWVVVIEIYLMTKDIFIPVFAIVLSICIVLLLDKELEKKVERKKVSLIYNMGEFLDRLTLLVNTGMTLTTAWQKAEKYEKSGPFYKELKKIRGQINMGNSFSDVLEDFSVQMSIPEISKFISLVVQNIKKGNEEIAFLLRQYNLEYWDYRKSMVKKLGEEASVKMIIPMMLLFGVILVIVMFPALTYFKL